MNKNNYIKILISIIFTVIVLLLSHFIWFETENSHISFKFDLFFIIMVLSFALFYKISKYIVEFKTVKNCSKADIFFLSVFFIFLFIPMCHINQEKASLLEKRNLAKWSPIVKNNKINYEFGKNFENYFNDRFFLRNTFLAVSDVKFLLLKNWRTRNVIKGKEGWLFLGWKVSTDSYTNSELFTDKELKKIYKYLDSVDDYCQKHNKKFYFLIAPDKARIYGEFYNDNIKKVSDVSKADQIISYANKKSNIKIIYPKDRLISMKGASPLYYKQDTHWNLLGAYYAYDEFMKVVKHDFPKVQVYQIPKYDNEKHDGDLNEMLTVFLKKSDDTEYVIPYVKCDDICKFPKEDKRGVINCNNKKSESGINLLMYRDSFSNYLIPYLANTFNTSKYIWKNDVNKMLVDNADIVVLEIIERNLHFLLKAKME